MRMSSSSSAESTPAVGTFQFLGRAFALAAALALSGIGLAQDPAPGLGLAAIPPSTSEERAQLVATADCDEHRRAAHGGRSSAERRREIDRELLAYQGLVEEALAMRAQAIRIVNEVRARVEARKALSGKDLQIINESAAHMLAVRAKLFKVGLAHECWLDEPVPALQQDAEIQAMAIAIGLSSALVLYDNYLSSVALYRSEPVLRQHLNRADSGFSLREGELSRIAASFASPDNRARVRRGLIWFEKHGRPDLAENDQGYRYLVQLIEQSPSRQMVRRIHPVVGVVSVAAFLSTFTIDTLLDVKNESLNVTSMLFGNTVGLVEVRRGKLAGRPEVLASVGDRARAGDILLEKTPFRLTDAFIPGHWGHAAVWIGTEAELRDLGIWNDPVVRPHHAAIRSGRGVVEALRSGVEMNTLSRFLNVDDVALLRQEGLSANVRAGIVLQALRQVGKAYDFNFDVETTDRIVCSELIYHAYGHLDWPTKRVLGRVTISPDNIAVRATGQGPLAVTALYRDGEEVAAPSRAAMEALVQKDVVRLARQ